MCISTRKNVDGVIDEMIDLDEGKKKVSMHDEGKQFYQSFSRGKSKQPRAGAVRCEI